MSGVLESKVSSRRPTAAQAEQAIHDHLEKEFGEAFPRFRMIEDGDGDSAHGKCGWAFWITDEDTTSYVREDLTIEWYGTSWSADEAPGP